MKKSNDKFSLEDFILVYPARQRAQENTEMCEVFKGFNAR